MEKEFLVGDLSSPASSEKDRGLQVTVSLPASIEKHLSQEAAGVLQEIGQSFLHSILLEAQRLASSDSQHLGLEISGRDVSRAEGIERKRFQAKRDKWLWLHELSLIGLGAGFSSWPSYPRVAFVVVSVSFSLLFLCKGRV